MIHELKVDPAVWQDLWDGRKTFEFRKNDRDFKVGDGLHLRLLDLVTGKPREGDLYSIHKRVTYILYGPAFGIPKGYCVMSIK